MTLSLSAPQARALHLAAQGLLAPPRRRATKDDVRLAVRRMALLQIDTIHVVARSPYLVLFSRLGPYEPRWLDELLAEAAIFEGWAHEACFAPIEDLALHRRVTETRRHWFVDRARRLLREDEAPMRALLAHVRASGPVKAADFAHAPGARSGWWSWKKEKRWLEAWLALGELMIARRENFHRVYDVTARVVPGAAAAPAPTPEEAARELVVRAAQALGVARAGWLHDYFRTRPRLSDADLGRLVDDGTLVPAEVEGWRRPGYVHRDHLETARRLAAGALRATHTALLSPFDPVVWDRARAAELFGFDYRLECYVPAPRRRFGYYVLPLLRRGALVGRLDAKAHRADGVFEVKGLWLEPGVAPGEALLRDLARALAACAAWHGTPAVRLGPTVPAGARRALAALLPGDAGRGRARRGSASRSGAGRAPGQRSAAGLPFGRGARAAPPGRVTR